MKISRILAAVLAIIAIHSVAAAQTPFADPGRTLLKPTFREIPKPEITIFPQHGAGIQSTLPFASSLPSVLPEQGIKLLVDHSNTSPTYYYNMPVVKPGKTSKILIAKLDANFPYSYNMPVRRIEIAKP